VSPGQYQLHVPLDTPITIKFQSVSHTVRSGNYQEALLGHKGSSSSQSQNKLVSRSLVLACFRHISSPLPFDLPSSCLPLAHKEDPNPQPSNGRHQSDDRRMIIECPDMKQMLGEQEAQRRGYKCWLTESDTFTSTLPGAPHTASPQRTSFPSHQRFYLIELESLNMIERDWKRLRYKYTPWASEQERSANGFYCEGDRYSWQRYTKYLPVMGSFVINSEQQTLTFQPFLPLYPGTVYGILLANGVPSVPSSVSPTLSRHTSTEDWYTIQEDLLFVFTTVGQKKELTSEERRRWNRQNIQLQRETETEESEERRRQGNLDENCLLS
jgi:hypothetical protein